MEIDNRFDNPYNFEPHLQPLFDAMKVGKKIKKIVCMGGTMSKDNPEKDFEIRNFVPQCYWVRSGGSNDSNGVFQWVDLVSFVKKIKGRNSPGQFYMNWVRSFEL